MTSREVEPKLAESFEESGVVSVAEGAGVDSPWISTPGQEQIEELVISRFKSRVEWTGRFGVGVIAVGKEQEKESSIPSLQCDLECRRWSPVRRFLVALKL